MKRITLFLLFFISLSFISLTSCKEDKYLDWRYINQQWLEQHKNDEGWKTTASGLQYKVIYEGIGDDRPSSKSAVTIAYTGTYINGVSFDSTTGYSGYLSSFVAGFQEGLKLMKENAIYEFRIPYELGYGDEGGSTIPPYTTLIFSVELKDFWTE